MKGLGKWRGREKGREGWGEGRKIGFLSSSRGISRFGGNSRLLCFGVVVVR